MGYRDDVDALYERSLTLQRELDAAHERLADRERELEQARGSYMVPEPSEPPAIRKPRPMPSGGSWITQLVNEITAPPEAAPEPTSAPIETEFLAPFQRRAAVLATAREHLDRLDDEMLLVVGTIIEELALAQPRPDLIDQLRMLLDDIAAAHRRRQG